MSILPQIKHVVVVMLENRSFDNLCGWLYPSDQAQPKHILPVGSKAQYNGLHKSLWNPSNLGYFQGDAPDKVFVVQGASSTTVPDPDPEETFENVTEQLYGPGGVAAGSQFATQGFLVNYEKTTAGDPQRIMETYTPAQTPVLSMLAQSYAISDAWHCSVPSQTWANRAFAHAGTSNGNVNNGEVPDFLKWDVPTIFNVLESLNVDWKVYNDTLVTPSLTRTMFMKLWDPLLELHFEGFDDFKEACAKGKLPAYAFVEPSFLVEPNDQHPPHDVLAGEKFLYDIWDAVHHSPAWNETLLLITYDEHGGCYDHVLPPIGAASPDAASNPGEEGFRFDRFGVRVPAVLVSPYIEAGTVFRSDKSVPYDHTSILATLRDWLNIPAEKMLKSKRIAAAPTLAQVLTLAEPRQDSPVIPVPAAPIHVSMDTATNPLQKSLVAGAAQRFGLDPLKALENVVSRQDALNFFKCRMPKE